MLNFRTIKFNFATRDREIIRIYYDTASCILYRVLDYIVKRSDFSGQPAREKHARGFSIKHNLQVLKSSKSTDQTNNIDVTDVRVEIHPIRHVS